MGKVIIIIALIIIVAVLMIENCAKKLEVLKRPHPHVRTFPRWGGG